MGSAVAHQGIEFQELGGIFIAGRVPVDYATRQAFVLLQGGVSVALAETMGSSDAARGVSEVWRAVGLDI